MSTERTASVSWHVLTEEQLIVRLGTSGHGLTLSEAARRLVADGPNEIQAGSRVTAWRLLVDQFRNTLILILLVATGISAFLGHGVEAVAIGVIVLLAAVLGFVQEYRAERSMEALRQMAAPTATVMRGGQVERVPARELVAGDVIFVKAGDKVPADARLLEAINLRVEEAALTGESVASDKQAAPLANPAVSLADRSNMLFSGTAVVYGRGRAVVVATGMRTEFGQVAQLLQSVDAGQTPLQENLAKVGSALTRAALVIVAMIVIVGMARGQPFVEMLIFGVALAVAVVPEALPAVVTISLAIGVQRMVRRNALIRRLPAVETLGSTTVICSDKTGTLTKDEMTVRRVEVAGEPFDVTGAGYEPKGEFQQGGRVASVTPALKRLLEAATLASDAEMVFDQEAGRWRVQGDPTEGALVVAAAKVGIRKTDLESAYPRVGEVPFTSETKRMTTVHAGADGTVVFSKGAPEILLSVCEKWLAEDGERELDDDRRAEILADSRRLANEALRVLAIATRSAAASDEWERGLTFLGLVGMIDPPRPEAAAAIERCRRAGIRVMMITGDHPSTAAAVARELGVLTTGQVATGVELDTWSDETLRSRVDGVSVFARVSPVHKLRVVAAMQELGHVAAMTGDGVNDAPALKKAAIGIAMGITGTDVTKEAAAMTLTDDNFASIVAAVEEGRGIFGNIKKYLMYLLSANIGEIGLMGGASLLGLPLPLSAVQLLYVNLATDGFPALALAVDPPAGDLMDRPPRRAARGIFTRPIVTLMLVGGTWSMLMNLGLFLWKTRAGCTVEHAMTLTFATLVLTEFFKAYNFRSDHDSIWNRPWANRWLNLAVLWELLLLVLIIHVPLLQTPFRTRALSLSEWALAIALAGSITGVLELAKWCVRRGWFGDVD